MTEHATIEDRIDRAAETVGSVWPLHSFVTANPLAGLEDRPFHDAVAEAEELFGGRGYPPADQFRQAWEAGRIDPDVLREELDAHGIDGDPEALLDEMADSESVERDVDDATATLDRVLSKWLAAFLDQGQAEWPMPNREEGFYAAWRSLAPYDDEIPVANEAELSESPTAALEAALDGVPAKRHEEVFEHHLAAMPGWTGFIKQRTEGGPWQTAYPVTLAEYLAVRLTLADLLDAPVEPPERDGPETDGVPLEEAWLTAWERSYRERLLDDIDEDPADGEERPDAQLVFCIDTRSEIIRRHVEAQGNYETHGYAGFFGVPMRYRAYGADAGVDACPPIVDAEHRIAERPQPGQWEEKTAHDRWSQLVTAGRKHLKALKTNVAAAFTFVEGGGSAYGAAMAARTLLPSTLADASNALDERVPRPADFCAPEADERHAHDGGDLRAGMTFEEKVEYAATAFDLMGWEEFAPLVVFTGHASETTNNPFDSSLDCGACAGNPGGPNARVLANICNEPEVQAKLRERGHDVPEDTVFLAAEHNTTTDEITLFDGEVPESHGPALERLREDLSAARRGAAAERAESMPGGDDDGVRDTERRTADWAETRPEWGLAGNASFVIGPRELTEERNLDGRAFLHSYDPASDPEGEALEAIMTGPLVVTQWINSQYYFATVDNAAYGSGSKVTQNPRGNIGVVQGNGGDLMRGLPAQSLMADADRPYHQPLRLTAVVHAPVERVTEILRQNEAVAQLLDHGWISLSVVDPERDDGPFHYQGSLEWTPAVAEPVVH